MAIWQKKKKKSPHFNYGKALKINAISMNIKNICYYFRQSDIYLAPINSKALGRVEKSTS